MNKTLRTNCAQVLRARKAYGQRRGESKKHHHGIVPKARMTQGRGSLWARHYHDASEPMETYNPHAKQLFT